MNPKAIAAAVVAAAVIIAAVFMIPAREKPAAAPPAKEHAEEGPPHVELSAEQIAKAGIAVETAGSATVRDVLPLYGSIVPNAERMREVTARYPGTIRSITKKIGDAVGQGEALAAVESNESLQTYTITAPLAGVVTARGANSGEQTGDKVLFTVADLSTVWVELSLFPRDAIKVRIGQRVRVKGTDNAVTGEGEIVYVAPVSASASQTRVARVQLENKDGQWAAGLYVTAEVTLSELTAPVTVLSGGVQTVDGKDSVFVRTAQGFAPRAVRLGRSDGEHTEVLDGIKAGETYASANSFILKAELGKGEAEHED